MVLRTWWATVGNASFDGWVKYQDLMDGIILSCELTEEKNVFYYLVWDNFKTGNAGSANANL